VQKLDGQHQGGDGALHVVGAAPVEQTVAHLGRKGSLNHCSRGSTSTASMCRAEAGSAEARTPRARRRMTREVAGGSPMLATSCGRPTKSRPAGRTGRRPPSSRPPRGRSRPRPPQTARDGGLQCGFVARRLAAVGAVVSYATSSAAKPTSSSRAARAVAITSRSSSSKGPLTCLRRHSARYVEDCTGALGADARGAAAGAARERRSR